MAGALELLLILVIFFVFCVTSLIPSFPAAISVIFGMRFRAIMEFVEDLLLRAHFLQLYSTSLLCQLSPWPILSSLHCLYFSSFKFPAVRLSNRGLGHPCDGDREDTLSQWSTKYSINVESTIPMNNLAQILCSTHSEASSLASEWVFSVWSCFEYCCLSFEFFFTCYALNCNKICYLAGLCPHRDDVVEHSQIGGFCGLLRWCGGERRTREEKELRVWLI